MLSMISRPGTKANCSSKIIAHKTPWAYLPRARDLRCNPVDHIAQTEWFELSLILWLCSVRDECWVIFPHEVFLLEEQEQKFVPHDDPKFLSLSTQRVRREEKEAQKAFPGLNDLSLTGPCLAFRGL